MGLLDRLLKRSADQEGEQGAEAASPCLHTELRALWDRADDIGYQGKATSFFCERCGDVLTREQSEQIRVERVERLRAAPSSDS